MSHLLGNRRRASIEMGGRIFMSGRPWDQEVGVRDRDKHFHEGL